MKNSRSSSATQGDEGNTPLEKTSEQKWITTTHSLFLWREGNLSQGSNSNPRQLLVKTCPIPGGRGEEAITVKQVCSHIMEAAGLADCHYHANTFLAL